MDRNSLTLTTGWYILKSKFPPEKYIPWIANFLSIVNNFNLVIYTDVESYRLIWSLINVNNKRIKVIIKQLNEFHTYKYKDSWIKNHMLSRLNLHEHTSWELNMLWNEKVFLVNETINFKHFNTEYYGWCDIGYFRNRFCDLNTIHLYNWPNNIKLAENNDKIHYGCVQQNTISYAKLANDVKTHYKHNLESPPTYQYDENCFAGGFFYGHVSKINGYAKLFDEKLQYYFSKEYIIKDDQSIIMDIIFTNAELFHIHIENNNLYENWFMFQRLLC